MIFPCIPNSEPHKKRSRSIAIRFGRHLVQYHPLQSVSQENEKEWVELIEKLSQTMKLLVGYLSSPIDNPEDKEIFDQTILMEIADTWIDYYHDLVVNIDHEMVIRDKLFSN
jgi:hypothetical protein